MELDWSKNDLIENISKTLGLQQFNLFRRGAAIKLKTLWRLYRLDEKTLEPMIAERRVYILSKFVKTDSV